jgi:hypothetical protein
MKFEFWGSGLLTLESFRRQLDDPTATDIDEKWVTRAYAEEQSKLRVLERWLKLVLEKAESIPQDQRPKLPEVRGAIVTWTDPLGSIHMLKFENRRAHLTLTFEHKHASSHPQWPSIMRQYRLAPGLMSVQNVTLGPDWTSDEDDVSPLETP